MGFEFELKFRATPETLEKIRKAYPGGQVIQMQTTYYDTPQGCLAEKKYTLRLRKENDLRVCTLKTPGGEQGRGEFEVLQPDIKKALPELCKLSGEKIPGGNLMEVCGAKFTRYAKEVTLSDCSLELAADEGVLTGGGKELPFCEIEVELKAGSRESVIGFARRLAESYGLQEEEKSKFKRALELAKYGKF